ncbi:alpha/beta fold hydrolase [Rhodococcus sp. NPDC003322]
MAPRVRWRRTTVSGRPVRYAAVAAAYRSPDLAERLVLVNSIWVGVGGRRGLVHAIRDRPLWDWGLHLPADLLPRRQVARVLPVALRDAVPNVLRNPVGVWEVARIARTANLTRELSALADRRLPIFVVWSLRDDVIPMATTMSLRAALGEPRTITVPGGHAWLMDDPRSFGEIITNVVFEAPEGAPSIGDMDADGRATGGHQCGPA